MLRLLFLFATIGCDSMGSCATKIAPPLEKINPSWGADPVDCEEERSPPRQRRGCSAKTFECQQGEEIVIESTTVGGPTVFGDDFWQAAKCTPARKNYENSPEAIYQLKIPPNTEAKIRLDRNCDEGMVPFAIGWDEDRCPTVKHEGRISQCEFPETLKNTRGSIGVLGKTLRLNTVKKPETFLVGVEGQRGASGNFRLVIRCEQYR